jgi:hypothetical protein
MGFNSAFKGLNAELNPICHLLILLGAHHILHVSRIKVHKQNYLSLDQKVLSLFHMIKLGPGTNELNPLPHLLFLPTPPYFPVLSAVRINATKSEDLNNVL